MPEGGARDGLGEGGVGGKLVVEGWMLAGGFDTVGEDAEVDGLGFEGSGSGRAIGDGGSRIGTCWSHDGRNTKTREQP